MQVNQDSIRFIEKGLAGVSMSMIADKIGIKKPSLYKHWGCQLFTDSPFLIKLMTLRKIKV